MSKHPGGVFSHFEEEGQLRLPTGGNFGPSTGGISIDADGADGPDIYVGNSPNSTQDRLYVNDGVGIFTNITTTNVPADSDYTRDVASADLNGDGRMDLLVTNGIAGNNKVYYNDKLDAGSEPGDFSYTGSVQDLGDGGTSQNAMEPGDFDGDGDLDVHWANLVGPTGDRILRNDGLDAQDVAQLVLIDVLPPYVKSIPSRRATVADLNEDGRVDLIVMTESSRPAILRNTSVLGGMSFVDWTPESAFPSGAIHGGWNAGAFDLDGDGDQDVLIGGMVGDHLFENVAPATFDEDDLRGGAVPDVSGGAPAAIVGRGGLGDADIYTIGAIASGSLIAVVLNGPDDYRLEVLNGGGAPVATSDRGTLGIEEALEHQVVGADDFSVRVTILAQSCTDSDADCAFGFSDLTQLLLHWGPCAPCDHDLNGDGVVGFADLTALLLAWGPVTSDYGLEVLARD